MKRNYTYLLCSLLLLYGCNRSVRLPDLKESYSSKDTKPFGAYVARHILQNCFPVNYVQTVKEPFDRTAALYDDTSALYFCVSRNLYIDDKTAESILSFVYNGNTAFFAASYIDSSLLTKIFCKTTGSPETEQLFGMMQPYRETSVRLIKAISAEKDSFSYYYKSSFSYFSEINDRYSRVVGYNAFGMTNCIVFFWGKGKLFLHTDPRAFSNYFLLTNDNYKYMQNLVKATGEYPQHVYWNDYYLKQNHRADESSSSTLSEIFKHPPLRSAFWLLLLMLLLFILFESKRRQRIIKEIKPNQNSSVAFTETVARLYFQKHDNKNIADKMITYFYEFIRSNYFLTANPGSRDFITALSKKSGISEEKTIALFSAINHAGTNTALDDYQLLSLNEQIQQFYKKRK